MKTKIFATLAIFLMLLGIVLTFATLGTWIVYVGLVVLGCAAMCGITAIETSDNANEIANKINDLFKEDE